MSNELYQDELSALALLNQRSQAIETSHAEIATDIQLLQAQLLALAGTLDTTTDSLNTVVTEIPSLL